MPKTLQCCWPGCYRKAKFNRNNLIQYEQERGRTPPGGSVGVICPEHVKEAIADEDGYALEMSAGEIIAELAVETPRWRFVHIPPAEKA